ncbi:unnamed protein product [Taenia asiatica]|uniref:DUF4819 domain-containing protein n=1 Tax=Taenia asiatica TaxID=60517 RepID=A0A0R3WEV4_TAEAS|nr:unnamed protein product [Taenia asiatica]
MADGSNVPSSMSTTVASTASPDQENYCGLRHLVRYRNPTNVARVEVLPLWGHSKTRVFEGATHVLIARVGEVAAARSVICVETVDLYWLGEFAGGRVGEQLDCTIGALTGNLASHHYLSRDVTSPVEQMAQWLVEEEEEEEEEEAEGDL